MRSTVLFYQLSSASRMVLTNSADSSEILIIRTCKLDKTENKTEKMYKNSTPDIDVLCHNIDEIVFK